MLGLELGLVLHLRFHVGVGVWATAVRVAPALRPSKRFRVHRRRMSWTPQWSQPLACRQPLA